MNLVSIPEFMNLTKVSERDVLAMLENGELSVQTGPMGELLIDINNLSPQSLARRLPRTQAPVKLSDVALLEEIIAREAVSVLDGVIDEALALALSWYSEYLNAETAEQKK